MHLRELFEELLLAPRQLLGDLDGDPDKQVAAAVRDFIARKHMPRDEFAFRTKLGKSTVDKLLIGLFSDRTLSAVEDHTKRALRPACWS